MIIVYSKWSHHGSIKMAKWSTDRGYCSDTELSTPDREEAVSFEEEEEGEGEQAREEEEEEDTYDHLDHKRSTHDVSPNYYKSVLV